MEQLDPAAGKVPDDKVIERCSGQGASRSCEPDDVSIGGQRCVANDEDSFKAVAVGLGEDVGGAGEVVCDETECGHVRRLC